MVNIKHEKSIDDILGIETRHKLATKQQKEFVKVKGKLTPLNFKSMHLFKINYHLHSSDDSQKLLSTTKNK